MDPFTIGIGVATILVSWSYASYTLGRKIERNTFPTIREYRELEKDLERADADLNYHHDREQNLEQDIARVEAQRDEYRRIAETHDIKMPEIPGPVVVKGKLWEARRFSGHPEENLENLATELQEAGVWDIEINLTVELLGSAMGGGGGFAGAIKKKWTRGGEPTKDIGPWVFHGTGKRAIADFITFLRDDDTGLMEVNPKSKKRRMWVDLDSPLVFNIDVAVVEDIEPPPTPVIQVVEVAVVEERIVERIVEREVFISIPEGREPELCGHTVEEIRSMVDEALARKTADDEVNRLSGLVREPPEDTRARLKRATKAKATQGG